MGIREDNQTLDTGGRTRYLKREGKVSDFQNKTGNDETRHEKNLNRDTDLLIRVLVHPINAWMELKLGVNISQKA